MIAHQAHQVPHGDAYSVNDAGMHNRGAQAANVAAHAAGQNQKVNNSKSQAVDREELARIVAEENESKGKLPKYPGLERWQLLEKMGDGAFSNVYKARDLSRENNVGEVAIKVVRKFEMNSNQVSIGRSEVNISYHLVCYACLELLPTLVVCCRAMLIFTRISRSSQKVSRCAYSFIFFHRVLLSVTSATSLLLAHEHSDADHTS